MYNIVLSIRDISFTYEDSTEALRNVRLDIRRNSRIAFLGANGAGKSTLFLVLIGILKPQRGKLLLDGSPITFKKSSLRKLRQKVGYVFQDPEYQLFAPTVYQEISFGPMNLGLPEKEVEKRVHSALLQTETGGLKDKHTQFLSYGQKKRVSVADIVAMNSSVLLLDEPTDSLDPRQKRRMEELLNSLNRMGKTIVLSTHDIDFAYSWADEIVVMKHGTVAAHGRPNDVFSDTELLESTDLAKPTILEVYHALLTSESIPNNTVPPRSKEELLSLIQDKRPKKEMINET